MPQRTVGTCAYQKHIEVRRMGGERNLVTYKSQFEMFVMVKEITTKIQ